MEAGAVALPVMRANRLVERLYHPADIGGLGAHVGIRHVAGVTQQVRGGVPEGAQPLASLGKRTGGVAEDAGLGAALGQSEEPVLQRHRSCRELQLRGADVGQQA